MATVPLPLPQDPEADPRVKCVFEDIRATRQTNLINNPWRALACGLQVPLDAVFDAAAA